MSSIENASVQRQTIANSSTELEVAETQAAVEQVAAVQQLTYDQLKAFWEQHQTLRQDTGQAFEVQAQQQRILQVEIEDQKRIVNEQRDILAQAAQAYNQQQSELNVLKETVLSPRGQTHWGYFAKDEDMGESKPATNVPVLIAGGSIPAALHTRAAPSAKNASLWTNTCLINDEYKRLEMERAKALQLCQWVCA